MSYALQARMDTLEKLVGQELDRLEARVVELETKIEKLEQQVGAAVARGDALDQTYRVSQHPINVPPRPGLLTEMGYPPAPDSSAEDTQEGDEAPETD